MQWIKQIFCCHIYVQINEPRWDIWLKQYRCNNCNKTITSKETPLDFTYYTKENK